MSARMSYAKAYHTTHSEGRYFKSPSTDLRWSLPKDWAKAFMMDKVKIETIYAALTATTSVAVP